MEEAQTTVLKRIPARNDTETLELRTKVKSFENVTVTDFSNFADTIMLPIRSSAKFNNIKHVVSNTFHSSHASRKDQGIDRIQFSKDNVGDQELLEKDEEPSIIIHTQAPIIKF